ncbi:uncharacterized protein [Euwallacea fornicatus]|uniref:uncharacterized protein n=1 Tax=Euwallacea fornicatus TaxID=995702 RepID=UPI00338EF85B
MKCFKIFCVSISALFLAVRCTAQATSEVSQLETFYYNKCLKVSGSVEPFIKLRTDVYEMYKYLQYAIDYLPAQHSLFCGEQRKNLLYRANEIKNDLNACLPMEEKFFAKFLKESFQEFLHFLCHNDAAYSMKFFSSETKQCRENIDRSRGNDLEYCLNRIFSPTKSYVTQSEICDDLKVTRKCFTQFVETNCPKSYDTKNLNSKFFDFISQPCSACANSVSLIMIFCLVLLHFFNV